MTAKIPQLRFKEFSREWEEKRLGEIAEYKNGGSYENKITENGRYNLITLNSINIFGKLKKDHLKVESGDWILKKNDLVMVLSDVAHGNFLGMTDLINDNDKYVLNQRMGLLRINREIANPFYIRQLINLKQKYFKKYGQGSSQQNLSKQDILKFTCLIPSNSEQKKIISFFVLIDTFIETLQAQKKSLELYKKGLMQKIFSDAFSKDNIVHLGEIADVIMGQSPDSSSYNLNNIGLPLIQGNADIYDRKSKPRQWTSEPTKICNIGEIIMTVRAPVGYIAKSIQTACLGRGVCSINSIDCCDQEYLYQFLLWYEKFWIKYEQGTTFPSVNSNDVKHLKIPLPSPAKQKSLAAILSKMDNLIESKQTQIIQAENWKKGLLQKMFI